MERSQQPVFWGQIYSNFGKALEQIGTLENDLDRLEEAVLILRLALEETHQERDPLGWARTQNHLGTALAALGRHESGTTRLEEAVAAFRKALDVQTRYVSPVDRAETESNLDAALAALAERKAKGKSLTLEVDEVTNAVPQGSVDEKP